MREAVEVDERPSEFVEALAKGLAILESFDAEHPEMTLSEVARRVGLSPAAARRSLLTLQALGYVGQSAKRFHLRPKVMTLGSAFYFSARVDEVLQPELRRLVELFGDASSVGTLHGHDVLYVAHYSEQRARRPSAILGARYPAHATSIGRVLLAGLSESELAAYLSALQPKALTNKTVTDKSRLHELIAEVREQTYATTVDQLDYGITAIAVPIRGPEGRPIAALNSSGYSGLLTADELVAKRLPELRISASRLAETIARYPMLVSMIGPH
jgi:IclR family transcriptional regulator, pca regulon regulatory protein